MAGHNVADRVYEGANVIDGRDIVARLAELQEEADGYCPAFAAGNLGGCPLEPLECEEQHIHHAWEEDDADAAEEYARLKALVDECENSAGEWPEGAGLIRDSCFVEYAQELAEDIGAIGKDLPWPACHIDWAAAADALRQDYSSVTYGETEYWVRS